MSEKSKMMADAWRDMGIEEKKKYRVQNVCDDEESELTPKDAKELVMRVAKRHQGEVCYASFRSYSSILFYISKSCCEM